MAGNENSGRRSTETPEEAFTSGRHFEAMRIARFAEMEAEATDQRRTKRQPQTASA